ncbi:thiamine-phosphate kinase, partial [candidate division NPL-UPA2 bacterium]|nr:thiamine-phosphate kinase [candidate division NPL-UPA2 bacterium]
YELLFTLSQKRIDKLVAQIEFPVSLVGEITEKKGKIFLVDKNNHRHPLKARGYEHFGRASLF